MVPLFHNLVAAGCQIGTPLPVVDAVVIGQCPAAMRDAGSSRSDLEKDTFVFAAELSLGLSARMPSWGRRDRSDWHSILALKIRSLETIPHRAVLMVTIILSRHLPTQ